MKTRNRTTLLRRPSQFRKFHAVIRVFRLRDLESFGGFVDFSLVSACDAASQATEREMRQI